MQRTVTQASVVSVPYWQTSIVNVQLILQLLEVNLVKTGNCVGLLWRGLHDPTVQMRITVMRMTVTAVPISANSLQTLTRRRVASFRLRRAS